MGSGPPHNGCGDSSSDEEEEPNWKAAIQSIASTTTFGLKVNGSTSLSTRKQEDIDSDDDNDDDDNGESQPRNPQKLKHYQIKAQKLLDDILEKNLEIVREPFSVPENSSPGSDGGVRLFKHSPTGIVFDHRVEIQGPRKRPRLLPRQDSDEKSKKLRQKIKCVAIDGVDIAAAATDAAQKALARLEAKEAVRKEKAKKEEERVAQLKTVRGERWLPSIAREK